MKYISRKGILLCEIAGQNVLIAAYHLREEVPYITLLNDTGAFCWKLLETGSEESELCRLIEEEFEIEETDMVSKDVHSLIVQLLEQNYIEVM